MSLKVSGLTKIYGEQRAVDDITFEAPKGKITGFLGPNGAGKSTTMKIATGYIAPTTGTVYLDDLDVLTHELDVKRLTGYLPEHNPLYLDMYVREFFRFIGRAYGVKDLKNRVEEMIELVGLTNERDKKIKALSKGYRQRVGLGQSMIHDPSILILDEPTTGLDPNQIVDIRNLIVEIAKEKTVILSTHIMQEVEAICDKVVILDKGKIVGDDSIAVLKADSDKQPSFIMTFEQPVTPELFSAFGAERVDDQTVKASSGQENLRAELLKVISENDLPLVRISKSNEQSLEDVFRKLTGKKQEPC